ncbi:sugar phosphate nucleotidyltransferase [Oceanibacterium hippocampi]|uniref:sugar phosphate nucleotidyltransferase n=1 Tax=Oceanibacterium hippocampi TaxID=745714 RepID=UPI000A26EB6E
MPAVILCGGLGTRFAEETTIRPKPMVEIDNRPILWHIMSHYALFGVRRFILCLGYKGDMIRDYFLHYWRINRDIEVNLKSGTAQVLDNGGRGPEDWDVVLAETGRLSQTGMRIRKVLDRIDSPTFFATYGDGVSTVDIGALYEAHRKSGRLATITGVRPSSRFGELDIEGGQIKTFQEKPQSQGGWINGGFMVLEKPAFDHLGPADDVSLERGVLEVLADREQLSVHCHGGFWQCMDTARERDLLNEMCKGGTPPWLRRDAE